MPRDSDWKDLMEALDLKGPTAEYEILNVAAKRIRQLQKSLATEHTDCIKWAKEVLPDKPMYFAHDVVWSLVAEVKRLRAELTDAYSTDSLNCWDDSWKLDNLNLDPERQVDDEAKA